MIHTAELAEAPHDHPVSGGVQEANATHNHGVVNSQGQGGTDNIGNHGHGVRNSQGQTGSDNAGSHRHTASMNSANISGNFDIGIQNVATQGVFSFSRRNDIREGADTNRGSRVTLNSNHGHNITGNQMNAEGTPQTQCPYSR